MAIPELPQCDIGVATPSPKAIASRCPMDDRNDRVEADESAIALRTYGAETQVADDDDYTNSL